MSDDEEELLGTPLDPLDEDNLPRKKPVTLEDQIACDDQGRRRFHGAFTGGFSAGYFNSVGSRDGWRPQQFKSTRSNKAGDIKQRPEDFMDDEDVGEFGFAPSAIRATQDYTSEKGKGTKRDRAKNSGEGPIPGAPVLHDLLKPVKERIGIRLLKKMGWRPGQGIGPRLTKNEKKLKNKELKKKVYGCFLPDQHQDHSGSESSSSDDDFAEITFAPDDYEPYRCNPKDNFFGIGYSGLDRRSVLSQHINLFDEPSLKITDKNKKLSIRGQAFGVGAFETEDYDIYARDDMTRYDFQLGPERKAKTRWSKDPKAVEDLEGFVKSSGRLENKKIFPAPELPKDFVPLHKVRKSRFSPLAEEENDKQKRYQMNADSRAKILNDERPSIIDSTPSTSNEPKKPTSIATKLIERALNIHGREQVAERKKLEQSRPNKTAMSWLNKLSATSFIRGETIGGDSHSQKAAEEIVPFSAEINQLKPKFADLDKQRRFEQYLNYSESDRKLKFASCQLLSMTDWEREQEVLEFEKTAKLCENIEKDTKENESHEEQKQNMTKINLDSLVGDEKMMTAAKMKMFGKLTRSDIEWKPHKIVCTRFNVAEPSVGVVEQGFTRKKFSIFDNIAWDEMSRFDTGQRLEREVKDQTSQSSRLLSDDEETNSKTEKEKHFEDSYEKIFGKESNKPSSLKEPMKEKEEIVNIAKKKDNFENKKVGTKSCNDDNELKLQEKNNVEEKMDLFKAIFLDSSDEENVDSQSPKPVDDKVKAVLLGQPVPEPNIQRNDSPPRGIFAELDLDTLMKRPEKLEFTKEKKSVQDETEVEEIEEIKKNTGNTVTELSNPEKEIEEKMILSDAYGPALPKELPKPDATSQRPIFTLVGQKSKNNEKWVEKKNKSKSKKEKKKHKHKKRSRSKSEKKSKKDKRH